MKKLVTCHLTLIPLFSLCLCAPVAFPQNLPPTPESRFPNVGLDLSEVEGLKGENLRLKFDSLDKQMRLLQEQFARLQQAQQDLVGQLQELENEILRVRGFHPGEASVNWPAKKIEKTPPRHGDTEKEKQGEGENK